MLWSLESVLWEVGAVVLVAVAYEGAGVEREAVDVRAVGSVGGPA